jgi:carboxymethylenebutenolidase
MKKLRSPFILFILTLAVLSACCSSPTKGKYTSGKKSVAYEVFGDDSSGPLLILLHGSSGPDVPLYRQQADYFAAKGYTVLFLHYFDATGSSMPSSQNYVLWAKAVEDLVRECQSTPAWADRKIALMGLSLGASVALAAGSQNARVSAIADWYGSLPDDFLPKLKGMPPLLILHGNRDDVIPILNAQQLVRLCGMEHFACESHFYQDQGHGFTKGALEDADARTLDFFARTMK